MTNAAATARAATTVVATGIASAPLLFTAIAVMGGSPS
jgi:hypothetical protein